MAAGGQAHAGHGNYEQWMNPISFPTKMHPHSLEFKSIVDVFDVNNVKKKALPGRMSSSAILGRPQEQEQSQKMNLGLVDFTFAPEYTSEDEETEKDGGIVPQQPQPEQEESPQKISDNQLISSSKQNEDQVVPQGTIDENLIVSQTLDHPDLEMRDFQPEFQVKDQNNLKVDNFQHAENERRVSTFVPRMMATDVMNINPLSFSSETMVVNQGGDEITPFKPQLIVTTGSFREGKATKVKPQKMIAKIVETNPRKAKERNVETVKRIIKVKKAEERRVSLSSMSTNSEMSEAGPIRTRKHSGSGPSRSSKISKSSQDLRSAALTSQVKTRTAKAHKSRALTSAAKKKTSDALRKIAKTSQAKNRAEKVLKSVALTSMAKKRTEKTLRSAALTSMAKKRTEKAKKIVRKESVEKLKKATDRRKKK